MKRVISFLLFICSVMAISLRPAFAINTEYSVETVQDESIITEDSESTTVITEFDDNFFVMPGAHNTTLLVKSISSGEYSEMMDILYPNGIVDAQGQEIDGVPDIENARAQFIETHMKAYSVNNAVKTPVTITPFTITIESQLNGFFSVPMYQAAIGEDTFVFPSEWGVQPFGFTCRSEKNLFLAFTDLGIWKIDPISKVAAKISSDTYLGQTQNELSEEFDSQAYLMWIDSVCISPDGEYIVYRTNRDASNLNDTSIWKIDLGDNSEERLVSPSLNNDIVGFLTDGTLVAGAHDDSRLIDIVDGSETNISLPSLSNRCIKGVKAGKIVFTCYQDDSSISTAHICSVDLDSGNLTDISNVSGYLCGEPVFSPSGNKLAFGYGTDGLTGKSDVMIVDTESNSQYLTSQAPAMMATNNANDYNNTLVSDFLWLDESAIMISLQEENDFSSIHTPSALATEPYDVVFGNTPPSIVNFISPLSQNSTSGFALVNSKWNQPRNVKGSNPHNGVDLNALEGTKVYAPYAGWSTKIAAAGNDDIEFLVDANKNGEKDDGDYKIRFYHMKSAESNGYKNQGDLIGYSGKQGTTAAHLHYGICSTNGGLKWLRNEVNYRYLSSNNWASGQDLDIYSQVRWTNNKASLIAYVRDDGTKRALKEVRIYYRTTPSGAWTDGGVMTKSGDTYTYDFTGKFTSGTTVYWMARLTRDGVTQAAFCPAKYYQPANNPNSASQPYGYWTNKIT